jgi:hypothetical protein
VRLRCLGAGTLLASVALASHVLAECPNGLKSTTTAELIFGRDVGTRLGVSAEDWRHFVDSEVSPRFPDGFTAHDAAGQWRGGSGRLVREPSKVLLIVLSGAPDDNAKLTAIRDAYKARFHQDAVLLIEQTVCAGF